MHFKKSNLCKKLQTLHPFWVAILLTGISCAADAQAVSKQTTETPSKIRGEDGWVDVSGFLDEAYGFVPLVVPITEPAVGFGGVAALVFIDKPEQSETKAGFGRPNITVVGGLRTDNGTKGAFAGDGRYWLDDRVQTLVGLMSASVNLEFSGIGEDALANSDPKTYNLDANGGIAQVKYRIDSSNNWVGLRYVLADVTAKFDVLPALSSLPDFQKNTRIAGVMPLFTYDSRDSPFTPTHGSYLDVTPGIFREALGSDVDFQRSSVAGMHYVPLNSKWTLGLRADAAFSSGDVPFYLRPYISMRGVPAMSYQGAYLAQTEAELRWQFWERFSVVGFGGAGTTWNNFEHVDNQRSVKAGGVGFRYEIARKYGLHMGLDIAGGPDGPAYYIQFGSAWMRP